MKSNILFSIIVPVYNVEKYLNTCVTSILKQTYSNYELILVNDGSTDKSGDICDEFAKKHNKIKVIHKENGGLSDARNAGIYCAKGDYVIFMDSDDYWDDISSLDTINNIAVQNNSDIITWRYKKYFENNKTFVGNIGYDYTGDVLDSKLFDSKNYIVSACSKAVKFSLIKEHQLYFPRDVLSEDIEWSAKLLSITDKISVSNLDMYVYRQRSSSISHTIGQKNINDIKMQLTNIFMFYQNSIGLKKEMISWFLSNEFANLVIALTAYNYSRDDIKWIKENKYFLSFAGTKRSKILKIMFNVLGVRLSIFIIGILRKI